MIKVISETRHPIKIWASDLEQEAESQLKNLASLPFIHKHVAAMADAHAGKGSTVGTVIATNGAIIPAAVGVDIGCGMSAVKLPFTLQELQERVSLFDLRLNIERSVPTGRYGNKEANYDVVAAFKKLGEFSKSSGLDIGHKVAQNAILQLGSLGGGNHFIELCFDKEGGAWIMLHSGSRNIGKHLASIHIDKAKNLMKEYFIGLPDPDLAYLVQGTAEFKDYLNDLMWAQGYAAANRENMLLKVLKDVYRAYYGITGIERLLFEYEKLFRVDCHHNYTSLENHFGKNVYVTRKGAVRAREGEYGIIPGSMGTKSYIVKGKGNADSFCSCSHGAGRKMSRTKARNTFTIDDLAKQTEGVECRKDAAVVDEIPSSYKDIDEVMKNQSDLIEPVFELKQVLCIKGA